jgi:Glycosyltransferase family 87
MKSSRAGRSSQALWYVLWSAILLVSAGNTLLYSPIFSGKRGLAVSGMLAAMACVQMLRGIEFLRPREAALCWALLIVFCLAQLVQFARAIGPPSVERGVDFRAYYLAGKAISEKHVQSVYQFPVFADGRLNLNADDPPFIYPPFFAVLMKPFAQLSFASAYLAWTAVTTVAVIGAVFLSLSVGGVRMTGKLALILGVGLFSYYPLFDHLFFGQISGVILILLAACVWLLTRNRIWPSALCLAAATLIKLTPVLVVPVLIFHRRWKWLVAYGAWMILLLGFSVWQAGWTMHQQFLHEVLPSMSCGAPVCQNTSIVAYVQELFLRYVPVSGSPSLTIPPYACAVSRWVAFAIYLLMLVRCYLRRRDGLVVRDIIVMVLLGIAISPISWWHHYTLALLPFIYFWCTMRDKGNLALTALFLAVATNVVGFIGLSLGNHVAQLIVAAIIPGLTIAVAYIQLAPRRHLPAESFEPDGGVSFSN